MFNEVEDEYVLLHLEQGEYFSLNAMGRRMFDLLLEKKPLPAIVDVIVAEYEVDAATVNKDIKMLVSDLIAAGILAKIDSDETGNLILEE